MKEQIEEMALIICGNKDCTKCISNMGLRKCGAMAYAERLYNAGYRKQSEVEMLQGALKAEELHNKLTMEMAQKALQNAKAEVANEIFEEFEEYFFFNQPKPLDYATFHKIKKKYGIS